MSAPSAACAADSPEATAARDRQDREQVTTACSDDSRGQGAMAEPALPAVSRGARLAPVPPAGARVALRLARLEMDLQQRGLAGLAEPLRIRPRVDARTSRRRRGAAWYSSMRICSRTRAGSVAVARRRARFERAVRVVEPRDDIEPIDKRDAAREQRAPARSANPSRARCARTATSIAQSLMLRVTELGATARRPRRRRRDAPSSAPRRARRERSTRRPSRPGSRTSRAAAGRSHRDDGERRRGRQARRTAAAACLYDIPTPT